MPPARFCQNSSRLRAPGKRPAMPTMAISNSLFIDVASPFEATALAKALECRCSRMRPYQLSRCGFLGFHRTEWLRERQLLPNFGFSYSPHTCDNRAKELMRTARADRLNQFKRIPSDGVRLDGLPLDQIR